MAIGECGLNFNQDFSPRPQQEKWFETQVALAEELQMPLFLDERDAQQRFCEILAGVRKKVPAVLYCFTGTREELKAYLDMDLHIGITGWICDERRGTHLRELVIPRGGSAAEARRFAERSKGWLERELHRLCTRPTRPKEWLTGTEILFRGEPVKIEAGVNGESGRIRLGSNVFQVTDPAADLRPAIELHLWRLAAKELPPRVLEFAALHESPVRRVTVRNQRSRWGSCSRRGTISLNWRLIQAPPYVRDYIILHELSHLKEMNHSARFWREVERVCPEWRLNKGMLR